MKLTSCRIAAAVLTFAIIPPAAGWAQQTDTNNADSAVIPPVPLIQKKNPNAIFIPASEIARFEQKAASATNLRVIAEPASGSKAAKTTLDADSTISTNAKVGSTFGYRRDPFTRREKFHSGCDIKAHWGQPVGASLPGTVQFAGWSHGYGNMIVVEHGGGIATHYAHLSSFAVEPGEHVERGSIVGYAGSTGRATSPHLHYEVRIDGTAVNPLDPIALDESSDFFKNTAAVRLIQPSLGTQNSQAQKADPIKPASDNQQGGPAQTIPSSYSVSGQAGTSPGNKAPVAGPPLPANPSSPANNDTGAQERPRRVTPQN